MYDGIGFGKDGEWQKMGAVNQSKHQHEPPVSDTILTSESVQHVIDSSDRHSLMLQEESPTIGCDHRRSFRDAP